jgi:hypothetical protein
MREPVHRSYVCTSLLALSLILPFAANASPSTITGLTMKPAEARAGASVSATAQGSGLCGAVNIDWGDGTAITYATSTLPVTQSHVYQSAGSFTVRAQGMGNCDGQATASVRITPAPAPPPAPPDRAPRVTGIDVSRPQDEGRGIRVVRVSGDGTCAYTLDFGDGNTEGRNAALPDVVRHNYPADGRYTIVATAAAPCSGTVRATAIVGANRGGRIARVEVRPEAGTPEQQFLMTVTGAGACTFTVDFGDGKSRKITEDLPYRFTYRYGEPGDYDVFVWTEPPCTGDATAPVRVRQR